MEPTKKWICDACGNAIESAKDGWVEWIKYEGKNGQYKGRGMRLTVLMLFLNLSKM